MEKGANVFVGTQTLR